MLMAPSMTPTQANSYIANRIGVSTVQTPIQTPTGTATITRTIVPIAPIAPRPVAAPVTTALPQPAFPKPVSPVPVTPAPVVYPPGPTPSNGVSGAVQTSIAQPTVTPNAVGIQPSTGYQEPQQYSAMLPSVAIPASTDVPLSSGGSTFGLSENSWLLILIFAAAVLFLVSE